MRKNAIPTLQTSNYVAENARITLNPARQRRRIWEIDFLRGVCVLLMILDHLAILLADFFGRSWYGNHFYARGLGDSFTRFCVQWIQGEAREIVHPIVLFVFFAISGISCSFSRSNAKRGLQLAVVALIYSLCSYVAQDLGFGGVFVSFGVLHFLAVSILIYALIVFFSSPHGNPKSIISGKRYTTHIGDKSPNKLAVMLSSAVIIVVTACLYFLYTPPATTPKFFAIVFPPDDFYGNSSLFYSQSDVSPGDLFTLIPYLAFFFSGTLLAPLLYPTKRSLLPRLDRGWQKPVSFVGRHALVVYVLHVVLLAGLLALISYLFITPGSWGF